jgi:BirA family biotin operon repressor/biotin-[acetyl-CoA-carboxylase] ligase
LLPLAAGVAVAKVVGENAMVKWPNDVLVDDRKVAGILVEGRPQERWAVVGVGLNVALRPDDFPAELRDYAGTMGLDSAAVEPTLDRLLTALEHSIGADSEAVLAAVRARDGLLGREVGWHGGRGYAEGIDGQGRLMIATADGRVALDAGEVHLQMPPARTGR